jgi:beta-glucanase (GH16 family)
MKTILIVIGVFAVLVYSNCSKDPSKSNGDENGGPTQTVKDMNLVWNDEFNGGDEPTIPDPSKWVYNVGGHGWGNDELQYYTERQLNNARVEEGKLIIEAHKETYEGNDYTSARLVTKSRGDWLYGRFEIKAKLPSGRGTWPAIWMLASQSSYGSGFWPDNGEIDIMEHVGYDPNQVHATVHNKSFNHMLGTHVGSSFTLPTAETQFHLYAIEWYEDRIDAYVDDTKFFTFENDGSGWEAWPFDKPFHLILNIAIGGSWGGARGVDDTIFPTRMEIDYVRVYQKTNP